MKKHFFVLFILTLAASFALANLSNAKFSDVASTHPNAEAIEYVQEESIVSGYPNGSYKPDKTINRAELTKIIVGAALEYNPDFDHSGMDIYSTSGIGFGDIEEGAWYNPYLRRAAQEGLINGYPDGTFRPAQEISFVEAAKIIVKGFEYSTSENEVWYKPFVDTLEQKKAIPTSINRFDHPLTRGEMAEMIYRLLEEITSKPSKTYGQLAGSKSNNTTTQDRVTPPTSQGSTQNYGFAVEMDYEDNGYVDPVTLVMNDDIDHEQYKNNIRQWFEIYAKRGITIIDFTPLKLEGVMLYDSPTLRAAGFELPEMGEVLSLFLEQAAKHNMKIVMQIEGIAHIVTNGKPYDPKIDADKLTTNATKAVIGELAALAKKGNVTLAINEEAFPPDYIAAITEATKTHNIEYMHFFWDLDCRADMYVSEDYAYYPYDGRNNAADQKYMNFLVEQGAYSGKLGDLNTMFGAAPVCNKPYAVAVAGGWGMGAKTHQNIALMRAVQFIPDFFQFIIASGNEGINIPEEEPYVLQYDFKKNLLPLLNAYGRKTQDSPKKIANIILDEANIASEDAADYFNVAQMASLSPITNAFLAAGYDLRVTKSKVYPNADIYYVYSPGYIYDEGKDLPSDIANLIHGNTPVFYQTAGAIPDLPNWQKVTNYLGISGKYQTIVNEDDSSDWDPIPETVQYTFSKGTATLKYGGYNFEIANPARAGKEIEGHYIHYINPTEIDATVLLTGKTAKDGDQVMDDTTALILEKNNVFFVNGSHLHLDMSHILANIAGGDTPPYYGPSYGYLTRGINRSVFYAPYDINIDINLLGGSNVTVFDEEGKQVTNPNVSIQANRLKGLVKKFHLVVVN